MHEKLMKIRAEHPDFDKRMVDIFAKKMPMLMLVMLDGEEYDCHIGSKDVAMLADKFIKNNKGEHIGFKWTYEQVMAVAKNYIDLENAEFYPCDLYVWANVKYGDMGHLGADSSMIIKYAISELTDIDFPYYHASQRAYYWLKKHIENEEKR
jgi:hypothetical protein